MSKYYELIIFTAALQDYADYIIDLMDTEGHITYRLYREHTNNQNSVYLKDLSLIDRDLNKTIIIDNMEENFDCQPDNGIPIKSWYDDKYDKELDKMMPYLKSLVAKRVPDVRPHLTVLKERMKNEYAQQERRETLLRVNMSGQNHLMR